MMAQRKVTDRAHRYRANALASGPRVCALCGSRKNITVDHKNGKPDDTRRSNLQHLCKSCNTLKGFAFKNLGKGRLTHQYNPAAGVPTFEQYAWAVVNGERDYYPNSTRHAAGAHDEAGAIIHATPKRLRQEYAARMAGHAATTRRAKADERWNPWPFSDSRLSAKQTTPATGGIAAHSKRRSAAEPAEPKKAKRKGAKPEWQQRMELREGNPGYKAAYDKSTVAIEKYHAARDAYRAGKIGDHEYLAARAVHEKALAEFDKAFAKASRRKNPAAASAEAFQEFHGFPSPELVTVKKKVHRHEHLAAAGELRGMSVKPVGGGSVRTIQGLGDCLLCFNESKNQLFAEGGDQFMPDSELAKFGIRKPLHELETLGKLVALDYFTNKTHLGDEGGKAVYAHKLRTTNENGRHVTVTIARYPDLIYRVLDQQFEFSGGSYVIRAEGIDK